TVFTSCNKSKPVSEEARLRFESIIPKPVSAVIEGKTFTIAEDIRIAISNEGRGLEPVVDFLARKLRNATGYEVPAGSGDGSVRLSLVEDRELGLEGYELKITEES